MEKQISRERVRQLLQQGCTQKQVAMRLGVSKSVICTIAKEVAR
jgi:transcriptional regulator with XRE-family HTH domain